MAKHYTAAFLLLFTITLGAKAQNNKTGIWGIATVILPGDSSHRWGGYAEVQTRSNEYTDDFFYYETKGGISYDLSSSFTALLGGGRYYTGENLNKQTVSTEYRMWEQMIVNQFLDRLKIEHRYRVEQRWVNAAYRNRFRYRINMFIPLNNTKIIPKTFFISVFEEIFLTNKAPHFERNRFSAALGYQFDKAINVQVGWLNQYNYNPTLATDKNNLAIAFMYRINRKNSKPKEHIPSTVD